jgi:hypothetical protein
MSVDANCVRHGVLYVRCVETEKTSSFHFKLTNASNAEGAGIASIVLALRRYKLVVQDVND